MCSLFVLDVITDMLISDTAIKVDDSTINVQETCTFAI